MPTIGWKFLILGPEGSLLCEKCKAKLEPIKGTTCTICGRPTKNLKEEFVVGDKCLDCVKWEESEKWGRVLDRNISIYIYNDLLKEIIARFKFRGDYVLARIFSEEIKLTIQKLNYDWIVPIPLSKERLYERGFNQAEALVREAGEKPHQVLSRIHSEKQSKKSREERIQVDQVFQISANENDVKGKRILLIDDIYTTGSTLRHAALILKEAGAENIQSLTLARG